MEFIGAKDLKVRIHSDNPVGRQNMQRIIRKNGWEEVYEILNESASSMRKEVEMLFESQKKDESTAKMSPDEYAKDLIHKMGADPNYTPRHTRQSMMDSLAREYILKMPTDTAAVEKEFDAALLLVKSGDDEAVKLGKKLGDAIVHGSKRERLLDLMRKAYLAFLDMPHEVDESAKKLSVTP